MRKLNDREPYKGKHSVSGGKVGGYQPPVKKKTPSWYGSKSEDGKMYIVCRQGETTIVGRKFDLDILPCWWWLMVNPKLLPIRFRKDSKKRILINGIKYGWGRWYEGVPPLEYTQLIGNDWSTKCKNFIRNTFGFRVASVDKGYMRVRLRKHSYIIVRRFMDSGGVRCVVYYEKTQEQLGMFVFSKDWSQVTAHFPEYGLSDYVLVLLAFMMDSFVYLIAAAHTNAKVEVVASSYTKE